jgi:hypothetical protein
MTQVCALPGLGIGDLDPQITALKESSSGKFDEGIRPSRTEIITLS